MFDSQRFPDIVDHVFFERRTAGDVLDDYTGPVDGGTVRPARPWFVDKRVKKAFA